MTASHVDATSRKIYLSRIRSIDVDEFLNGFKSNQLDYRFYFARDSPEIYGLFHDYEQCLTPRRRLRHRGNLREQQVIDRRK